MSDLPAHVRFQYGDRVARYRDGTGFAYVVGPAEYHPPGTSHGIASTYGSNREHETQGFWCYPLVVAKGWGRMSWVPRWWRADAVFGRTEMCQVADEFYQTDLELAQDRRDRLLRTADQLSSGVDGIV